MQAPPVNGFVNKRLISKGELSQGAKNLRRQELGALLPSCSLLPPARRAEAQAGGYLQRHPCEAAPGVGMVLRSGIALLRSNLLRAGCLFKLQKNNNCRNRRFGRRRSGLSGGGAEDHEAQSEEVINLCSQKFFFGSVRGFRCRGSHGWRRNSGSATTIMSHPVAGGDNAFLIG